LSDLISIATSFIKNLFKKPAPKFIDRYDANAPLGAGLGAGCRRSDQRKLLSSGPWYTSLGTVPLITAPLDLLLQSKYEKAKHLRDLGAPCLSLSLSPHPKLLMLIIEVTETWTISG